MHLLAQAKRKTITAYQCGIVDLAPVSSAESNEAAGHRQHTGRTTADLLVAPCKIEFVQTEAVDPTPADRFIADGCTALSGRVVGATLLKGFSLRGENRAAFIRPEVEDIGLWIVAGRIPIGATAKARANPYAFFIRNQFDFTRKATMSSIQAVVSRVL